MNNRKRAQLQRYTPAFGVLEFFTFAKGGVQLECRDCGEFPTFTTAQVRYALATGKPLRCECTPECHTPEGFTLVEECKDYRVLSCDSCSAEYHRELRSRYFSCFCGLKIKSAERDVFDFVKSLYPRVSREEHYPGSRHKADLKVYVGEYVVYIEIDGASHNNTVQRDHDRRHEESFLEHRSAGDFLLRMRESSMVEPGWGDYLEAYLGGISEETPPISRF